MSGAVISVRDLTLHYGEVKALGDLNIDILPNCVTAIIGPSGCGKSTFLRVLNRLNDLIPSVRVEGKVLIDGCDIYSREVDVVELRKKVGMVFQKSNPFPKTVFDNVAYGPRIHGVKDRGELQQIVIESIKKAALWDEVKDRLYSHAFDLSGGQQQRLCIARALAVNPKILLMDEPASALDPISTIKIEDLIHELKKTYTLIIVTHNMQQAARVADITAFLLMGELVEFGPTNELFTRPKDKRTEAYITGRFG